MTSSVSRQTLRRQMYDGRVPGLGFAFTADSVAAGSITSAGSLADTNLSTSQFTGMYIHRPDVTAADKTRVAGALTLATGVLTQTGANYSDTTDTNCELIGLMHPDELNACIQRAAKRVYRELQLPLAGMIEDGDMEAANTTSWTSVGTPSAKAKDTTAANVWSGTQALHVANDAAGEGVKSVAFQGFKKLPYYCSVVVKCAAGTAKLQVYDETNSIEIASVTSGHPGWVHLWQKFRIPDTCESVTVRLIGVEDTADIYWNHAVFYYPDEYQHPAPSWLDEQFKFLKLREARYDRIVDGSSQTYGNYHDANTRRWMDWAQPGQFSLDVLHTDAHPYQVVLKRPVPDNELWIEAKRPWYDTHPLDSDSATTYAPQEQMEAAIKLEIARVLAKRYPNARQWVMLLQEAEQDLSAQEESRPEMPLRLTPRQQPNRGRI